VSNDHTFPKYDGDAREAITIFAQIEDWTHGSLRHDAAWTVFAFCFAGLHGADPGDASHWFAATMSPLMLSD
jgi:hypothetical protein